MRDESGIPEGWLLLIGIPPFGRTIIILFYWFLRDNQKELMPGMNYSVDDQ